MKKTLSFIQFTILWLFFLFTIGHSQSMWEIDDGWAIRDGRKFFAIGAWGLKDINRKKPDINRFKCYQNMFNIIVVQTGNQQNFMKENPDALFLAGNTFFDWRFRKSGYIGDTTIFSNNDHVVNYQEMKTINDNFKYFNDVYIPAIADSFTNHWKGYDIVWFLKDEPASHSGNKWYWHPKVIESYHNAAGLFRKNTLTYVDLFGNLRGNIYLYERLYKNATENTSMPDSLPVYPAPLGGDGTNYKTYMYSYDGTPVYDFPSSTERNIDYFVERGLVYNTVKYTARSYSAADILGINAYGDFNKYPHLAGLVVDAIKDACGSSKPVWNFYNGNGYGVRHIRDYVANIKNQIYIALIHGSSGVLFWGGHDEITKTEYWETLKDLVKELNLYKFIYENSITIDTDWTNERIQWKTLKYSENDLERYFLIAVNLTSTIQELSVTGIGDITLEPEKAVVWTSLGYNSNLRKLNTPQNLSFERTLDTQTEDSMNWEVFKSSNTQASRDTSEYFLGTSSLYLYDQNNNGHARVQQFFDCLPNTTYKIKAWHKGISGNQNLIIQFYDNNGWLSETKKSVGVTSDWEPVELTTTSPSNAKRIKIHFGTQDLGSSSGYWDEIILDIDNLMESGHLKN